MRNIFLLALIGGVLILGLKYISPETELQSLFSLVGIFITLFLAYSAKTSADESTSKSKENAHAIKEISVAVDGRMTQLITTVEQLHKTQERLALATGQAEGRKEATEATAKLAKDKWELENPTPE